MVCRLGIVAAVLLAFAAAETCAQSPAPPGGLLAWATPWSTSRPATNRSAAPARAQKSSPSANQQTATPANPQIGVPVYGPSAICLPPNTAKPIKGPVEPQSRRRALGW